MCALTTLFLMQLMRSDRHDYANVGITAVFCGFICVDFIFLQLQEHFCPAFWSSFIAAALYLAVTS